MDQALEQALDFSNIQHTLYLEKRRLQEKLRRDLELVYAGGRFTVDRNLIVFLHLFNLDEDGSVVILDDNQIPTVIQDPNNFQKEVQNTYYRAVNAYRVAFEELKKKRSVKAIVGL